ncbi:hypothetical protein H4R35_006696 [Dimargaris xerosporica]|nr:hypothetical protein H4R35_006696 [Dimargaris xerosporica]
MSKRFSVAAKQSAFSRFSYYVLGSDIQVTAFTALWLVLQALVFGLGLVNYRYNAIYQQSRELLGWSLVFARASALVIHVDTAVVLFPVCRTLVSMLRSTPLSRVIPFDRNLGFHRLCGYSLVVFTIIHTASHYANYAKLAQSNGPDGPGFAFYCFVSGPGLTGHIMLLSLILMTVTAQGRVRQRNFEAFWYTHHLFIVFFAGFTIHGGFCLVKPDSGDCTNMASFWKYWIASGVVYLAERTMREVRARHKTMITKVVQHPSNTVEIQIRKDFCHAKAGQYIFVCCPEISLHQWHPFTLTSAPEEQCLSIHMRTVGNWTRQFAERLGCELVGSSGRPRDPRKILAEQHGLDRAHVVTALSPSRPTFAHTLPQIVVDGPFGCASEDVFNYEVAFLVGAGIGVTPFASVLKSIWYRANSPSQHTRLRKVYFFWIARDKECFEWFQSLLKAIENEDANHYIEIRTYLTGRLNTDEVRNVMLNDEEGHEDALTGLKSPTYYGRPNWDQVFFQLRENHPATDIGVFFCGPKRLDNVLHMMCRQYNDPSEAGTKFFYNKENF